MKTKIGIIGYGFVGRAIANAHDPDQLLINDPLYKNTTPIGVLINDAKWIYVCLPTPEDEDGGCDLTILSDVLYQLRNYSGTVICKSTALPSFYSNLEARTIKKVVYKYNIVHMPEFLTANNANDDYMNPSLIVIGGTYKACKFVEEVVLAEDKTNKSNATIVKTSISAAAAMKYYANSFLATKVVFNHEFAAWCASQGVKWNNVAEILKKDPRLGQSHWRVPGPDGEWGYGGACFPKDIRAILTSADKSKIGMDLLGAQFKINAAKRNRNY